MRRHRISCCLLVLAGPPVAGAGAGAAATAQQIVDQGALAILRNGTVIGREEFVVRRGHGGSSAGYTVTTTAYYPAERPTRTIMVALTVDADSQAATAQFELFDGQRETVLMSLGSRRVIVRVRTAAGESAREYPGADRRLVTRDSVHAIYAIPPRQAPGPVRLVSPSVAGRTSATLTLHGSRLTDVGGTSRTLNQISLEGAGGDAVHLWYDEQGRLMKVAVPARNLVAVRLLAPHR